MPHLLKISTAKVRPLVLLALCCAVVGCKSNTPPQSEASSNSGEQLPPIVATVNDRPISTKLYEMYLKNGRDALNLDQNSEEGRKKLEQLKEGIVSELIDRTLIAEEAERRGLQIPPDKLAEAEQRSIQEFGGDRKYDEYLKENHLTRDEYRDVIRMEVYGEMMREELSRGLTVAEDDVKKYYDAHKGDPEFQVPERVTASHILIAARPTLISQQLASERHLAGDELQRAVKEEMDRRRKTAEELRRKAQAGADFAALARQSSEDPASRERGGDLGTFTRNTHTREFDDAAFALKPGAMSDVIQTDFGFHLIKVSKHDEPRAMTFDEATPEIRKRLLAQRQAATLADWLKDARHKVKIQINEPFRFGALKAEFP
ncbi:MAG: peptidylprolyl isomerase [Acidobacteriota bacterium]|nr:peptidylprolyl isomerase [Acidobacteriota bacterium]